MMMMAAAAMTLIMKKITFLTEQHRDDNGSNYCKGEKHQAGMNNARSSNRKAEQTAQLLQKRVKMVILRGRLSHLESERSQRCQGCSGREQPAAPVAVPRCHMEPRVL